MTTTREALKTSIGLYNRIGKLNTQISKLRAENERLRALVGQLVSEAHGYKPYARFPVGDWDGWVCMHCLVGWSYDSPEHHADDCPVVAAREFMIEEE